LQGQGKAKSPNYFTSFNQTQASRISNISCAVLAGSGVEFLERFPEIPVIFFTWMDSYLIPASVALIFDDSPWIQAVPAVKMAITGEKKGQIPSRPVVLRADNTGKEIREIIKKSKEGQKIAQDDLTKS
jgi:hypothetical protein